MRKCVTMDASIDLGPEPASWRVGIVNDFLDRKAIEGVFGGMALIEDWIVGLMTGGKASETNFEWTLNSPNLKPVRGGVLGVWQKPETVNDKTGCRRRNALQRMAEPNVRLKCSKAVSDVIEYGLRVGPEEFKGEFAAAAAGATHDEVVLLCEILRDRGLASTRGTTEGDSNCRVHS